jgi:hypothetical protein
MIEDPFELPGRAKTASDLPKMVCTELVYETCETELQELKIAQILSLFLKQIRTNTNVCLPISQKKNF